MTFELLVVLIAGFIGGFVGAQVGAGALITLPALMFLGIGPLLAIGTNVLSGWLINVAAVARFWKSGNIDLKLSLPIAVISWVGAIIGSDLVLQIDLRILSNIVIYFFIALLAILFIKPKAGLTSEKPGKIALYSSYLISFIIGIYGGFFSVGTATFLIFMFVLLLKKNMLEGGG